MVGGWAEECSESYETAVWTNSNRQEHWMSELSLILSRKLPEADDIRAELSKHLKVGQPGYLALMSADPAQPSFVKLLGDAVAWLPLYAAATAYLATLAKRAAEATWDKIVKRNEVKPLADVATTVAKVAARVDVISVGLNIPDDYLGTSVSIKSSDPEEVAHVLAHFVVHVEPLSKAMQDEVAAGRRPYGPVTIELQEDESLLVRCRIRDGDALVPRELKIPRTRS